ncbi:hypothetical protein PQ478_08730 [Alkalihalophilus pseudofirmus]|uniref:hypothetical protein n=1 Tax=Alkalihalophilus pseudofirmus TaxID=79885 RepID=UPI00259B4EF7|nr:hypothetical protein [Alkalihalophilus pseudofirmus]WEG18554.1 hypothetical protein PQ478_08730 [Alkalihalophilus pseudofirmus]
MNVTRLEKGFSIVSEELGINATYHLDKVSGKGSRKHKEDIIAAVELFVSNEQNKANEEKQAKAESVTKRQPHVELLAVYDVHITSGLDSHGYTNYNKTSWQVMTGEQLNKAISHSEVLEFTKQENVEERLYNLGTFGSEWIDQIASDSRFMVVMNGVHVTGLSLLEMTAAGRSFYKLHENKQSKETFLSNAVKFSNGKIINLTPLQSDRDIENIDMVERVTNELNRAKETGFTYDKKQTLNNLRKKMTYDLMNECYVNLNSDDQSELLKLIEENSTNEKVFDDYFKDKDALNNPTKYIIETDKKLRQGLNLRYANDMSDKAETELEQYHIELQQLGMDYKEDNKNESIKDDQLYKVIVSIDRDSNEVGEFVKVLDAESYKDQLHMNEVIQLIETVKPYNSKVKISLDEFTLSDQQEKFINEQLSKPYIKGLSLHQDQLNGNIYFTCCNLNHDNAAPFTYKVDQAGDKHSLGYNVTLTDYKLLQFFDDHYNVLDASERFKKRREEVAKENYLKYFDKEVKPFLTHDEMGKLIELGDNVESFNRYVSELITKAQKRKQFIN